MNIGILGTGAVGQSIATALVNKGHNVMMGSRSVQNEKLQTWLQQQNEKAQGGSFAEAAAFGEIVFLCLNGAQTLTVVQALDADSLLGKVVIDVTNPLDFSAGMPPRILSQFNNGQSLGEAVQQALPQAHVVKALNTVNAEVMVNPNQVANGDHHLPMCGNDAGAKQKAKDLFTQSFGWKKENLLDLGGIGAARTTEAYVPLWVGFYQHLQTHLFNIKLVH